MLLINMAKLQIRSLSISQTFCSEGRMLKKIMAKPRKQRKFINDTTPVLSTTNSLGSITGDGKKATNSKRINVLNKLFMRYITDLMSTGTCSNAFTGHGIEINRVKVTTDFKIVKVYWLARSEKIVDNIDEILKSHASGLRHELSQLHVIGIVPRIEFVKDNHYTFLKLLDEKLTQADYGEDHEPVDASSKLKKELELQTKLEVGVSCKIAQLETNTSNDIMDDKIEELNLDCPLMPQNVFGLDHARIMQHVKKNVHQGLNRKSGETSTKLSILSNDINHEPISYPSMKLQRVAFREFLNKRLAVKHKLQRGNKTDRLELDYLEEEALNRRENDMKKYDFYEYLANENDYIDDATNDNQELKDR